MMTVSTLLSGSYDPEDVNFLLKPVRLAATEVEEKEKRIQSGSVHYSEMISKERRPDPRYLDIFEASLRRSSRRMGMEIARIAETIVQMVAQGIMPCEITLCSLVRAGVPYGVLIHRVLKVRGIDCVHYGVSIIRDRGLDKNAMNRVFATRNPDGILFVDGWTGKGAISRELHNSFTEMNRRAPPKLVVVADPAGFATLSGSHEDWLIPSGILGANVSGLISRSILNADVVGPNDFHGTVIVDHLRDIDYSQRFVNTVFKAAMASLDAAEPLSIDTAYLANLREESARCVLRIADAYGVDNHNRIKPGIAEATRAVLRRRPDRIFVRNLGDPDVAALIHLCRMDKITISESPEMTGPYRAVTLIEKVF